MAVCEFHLNQGNALQKMTSLMAIVPDDLPGPFPVFYLLHGLSDNHTSWLRWSNIDAYVRGLPLIVVMPNGERGFYTDSQANPKAAFETNLITDIVGFVDRTFQTIPTRAGRVIAGLSMGGYGAVKLALKHPHLFCAAVSHSGAVGVGQRTYLTQDAGARNGGPSLVNALRADRMTSSPWLRKLTAPIFPPSELTAARKIFCWTRTAPCTRI